VGIVVANPSQKVRPPPWRLDIILKGGDVMKALFAVMALVMGLTFGAATFVQADEKKPAPTTDKKDEKKKDDKGTKK